MAAAARWDEVCRAGTLVAEPVAPGVLRLHEALVSEAERAWFYLVEGFEADLLVDGGWGLAPGLGALRADAGKPLVAVATHSHVDHVGLLHLARRRYGHAAEAGVFADPSPHATQALPYLIGRALLADGRAVEAASIRQTPCPLDHPVGDGDVIEIGGRSFDVLHVPGHSPGSLALIDRAAGLLFCADTVHDGDILDQLPGSDPAALLRSQARLAELDFALALPGHGSILARREFLAHVARHRAARMAEAWG